MKDRRMEPSLLSGQEKDGKNRRGSTMLEKAKIPFVVSLSANGDEIINKLLDIVKNLLHPIMTFMVALCRVLYPPLIVVGIILWAIGERWLAWRFLSSGLLTGITVEIVLPALGLI
jgi:hypothetical protein